MNNLTKNNKNNYIPISVLQLPPKSMFIDVTTPNNQYTLHYLIDRKMYVEGYRISIPKTKLFTDLEVYQWRRQTLFPISKTQYVNIKPSNTHDSSNVQLLVYNQYCPQRLSGINDMNLSQVLYMLKQSILGFQRLVNRFGLFVVNQNMIRINEKGLCRVWIHQNFARNSPLRSQIAQQNMLKSVQQILLKHCNQSKIIKRLFSKLKDLKTFISVLRQIQIFVSNTKITVPSKFSTYSSQNYKSSKLTPQKTTKSPFKPDTSSSKNYRNSVISLRKQTFSICNQDSPSFQKINKHHQNSEIKKIKSTQTIGLLNSMKKSDGQTTYTRNIKQTKHNNQGFHCNSSKQLQISAWQEHSFRRNHKWLEDSSLVIDRQAYKTNHIQKKDKKDLTYSQSVLNPEYERIRINNTNNRSFNFNNSDSIKFQPFLTLGKTMSKNSQQYSYADQFNNLLQDSNKELISSSALTPSKRKISENKNVQKLRTSHTQTVIKNNGWRSITGLLEKPELLNSSFQEGEQQNLYLKQIKLQKLQSLGRRGPAMSILPQEFDDII